MLLCANVSWGQQLVANPTFTGNITNWANTGSTTAGSSVAYEAAIFNTAAGSLKLNAVDATSRAQSANFTGITAGNYTLTMFVKGAVGKKFKAQVFQSGAGKVGAQLILDDTWQSYTITGIPLLSTGTANLRLWSDDATAGVYYFDDVYLTYVPPAGSVLTTNVVGSGTVAKSPNLVSYPTAQNVTLTATPATHWLFNNWTGDLTGTTNPDNVSLDGTNNKAVTANFTVDPAFDFAFNYNSGTDLEGWAPDAGLTASVSLNIATLTPTANQFARFGLLNFPIPTANYNKVTVVLQNNSATTNELAIIAGSTTGNITAITTSDSGYQTYVIDLTQNAGWTGSLTSFKLRFANAANSGKPSDTSTILIDSIIFSYVYPTTYYYKGTGSLATLSNWSSKEDGSGAAPINFTTDGITYRIQTNAATDASWTVSGVGSKVIFGKSTLPAITLTVADTFPIIGTIDITTASSGSNSVLWQDATSPSFGSLNTNSEVHFQKSATFTFATSPTFGKLFIDNSAAVTFGAGIKNVTTSLNIGSGSSLATGDGLTLKSTATKTAVVAPVLGSISGDVIAERYIPAGNRAYRLLSSPVTTSTSLKSNWQEGGSGDPFPGYGTHITGNNGLAGFDATTTNAASLFIHNNTSPAWSAALTTNFSLTAGEPFLIYIRGSRQSSNITSTTNDATTLRTTGALKTGTVTVTGLNTNADGFSLIGNPYQAQVDMQAVLLASTDLVTGFYYVVDPSLGTKGAYLTVDVTAAETADISKNLQPGQACFVKTVTVPAAAPTLSFIETNKVETPAQTSIFRTKNTAYSSLDLTLMDGTSKRLDVLKVAFAASETNTVNENDASKLTNFDENMASSNSGKLLAIEKRAVAVETDEIPLNITKYRGTSYVINAKGTGMTGAIPYLVDSFANTITEIPQNGSVDYAFTVDASTAASIAADRFKITYTNKTLKTIDNAVASLALYPNPSKTNSFSVVVPQGMKNASLRVSNLLGQQVYTQNGLEEGATARVTVSNVKTAGVYLVSLTSEGKTATTKWIVE